MGSTVVFIGVGVAVGIDGVGCGGEVGMLVVFPDMKEISST